MFFWTNVLLPVLSLAVGLRTWRLAYNRGWREVLPIFCRYIAFYCISTTVLLAAFICSLYPARMQATICLLHSYAGDLVQIVTLVFLLAVLDGIVTYAKRSRAETPSHMVALVGGVFVAAAFALAIAGGVSRGAPNFCLRLAQITGGFARATNFILIIVIFLMFVSRTLSAIPSRKNILLIVAGLAQAFLVEFAVDVAVFKGHWENAFDLIVQLSGLGWWILWWLAVRKAPDEPATQSRAAAVPV